MKKIALIIAALSGFIIMNAQVNFDNNTITGSYASAIGTNNTALGQNSFVAGYNSEVSGDYAFAIGNTAQAGGLHSIALGSYTTAGGVSSIAIGPHAKTHSSANFSFALGNLVETTASGNFVLGIASDYNNPLVNTIPNSLMIGFQSDIPTFFVGTSNGPGTVGKVGIGTTNPVELLTVNGNILCKEITVTENVPESDFVFKEGYPLMSLKELEAFIKENHHLPEIPSAEEFKANGYNVGDMDNLLLQKIEELTLYIIAQQKLIEQLMEEKNSK